ncbi:hypothetical protein HPB50_026749 [Hyalomma asiaticum]|uniref:Uncharacterized protein n=1 Tax=Hyalomma asiaticum TaxID=266040 RepID=A0ACB7RX85_HYAAI|nr:hypothetical protein HPB50_026749 [Hyalomma asiaticum]
MDAAVGEATQSPVDEKWVFLQHSGDAANEPLHPGQDGDATREKESDRNAAEPCESARGQEKVLRRGYSTWKDVLVQGVLGIDWRPYVIGAALSIHTLLHLLAALPSVTEDNTVQVLLFCLKHFTTATLIAAAFSCVTRSLYLAVVKASAEKKNEVADLMCCLLVANVLILLAACFACLYYMGAGIKVFQEARREEHQVWYLQLLADMARMQALTGAVVLTGALAFQMATDVGNSFRTVRTHCRDTAEAEKWWGRDARRLVLGPVSRTVLVITSLVVCTFALALTQDVPSPDGRDSAGACLEGT